jgi:hypothetical protein
MTDDSTDSLIRCDFGTFHGYNIEQHTYLERPLTAAEVVAWNHRRDGIVEFWPSGDREELRHLLGPCANVGARLLVALERLLGGMGGATTENFLRLHFVVNGLGYAPEDLSPDEVADLTKEVEAPADERLSLRQRFRALEREYEDVFAG